MQVIVQLLRKCSSAPAEPFAEMTPLISQRYCYLLVAYLGFIRNFGVWVCDGGHDETITMFA